MTVFALTEHMPRHEKDFYPEEIESGATLQSQFDNEAEYIKTAKALRRKYSGQIEMPIGFESDWCGPHSLELIERSINLQEYDFFMGSIHHVKGIPIDYDNAMYESAKAASGGTDESLFGEYYDEQLHMLQSLRPPTVGHFDLIRLKSSDPNVNWLTMPDVWSKILRNLDFVTSYGGMIEINTAAMRKGMNEPYPASEICQVSMAGNVCFRNVLLTVLTGISRTRRQILSFRR